MMQLNLTGWMLDIDSNLSDLFSLSRVSAVAQKFLVVLLFIWPSIGMGNVISAITFSSNLTPSEAKPIIKSLGLVVGEPIYPAQLDKAIKKLTETGKVLSVFVRQKNGKNGAEIIVDARLRRKINSIDVSAVSAPILSDIRPALADLEPGKILDDRSLFNLKQAIRSAYESRGYFFVDVDVNSTRAADTEGVDISVSVNQGIPTKVTRIKISNVDKELSHEFRRAITLKIGSPFTRLALEESINSLNRYFKENQYPDSKVDETNLNFNEDKTKVEVDFVLKIGKKYQISFKGNSSFSEDRIKEWITSDVLAQSDPVRFIEQLITFKYKEVGFHFCKVDGVLLKNKDENVKSVRFDIDEGPKVIVDSVTVVGASSFGESQFKKLFYQNAEGVLARGVFFEDALKKTCDNMVHDLEEQGYLRVSLPTPRVSFTEDKKGADLFFNVELGNQSRVSRIDILGVTEERRKEIEPLISLKVGDPVQRSLVEKTKSDIEHYFWREGYTEVKFAPGDDVVFGEDPAKAIVRIAIEEGPQFFVGEISVEGNKVTKSVVIEREIRLGTGDKYNLEKIRQTEDELLLTGLFSRAEIIGTVDPKDPAKKNIKVVVVENKAGSGELGLGAVYEDPRFRLRGFVGLSYNNTFGLNQTTSIRTEVGLPLTQKFERVPFIEYSAILGYRAPYLFNVPAVFFSQASLDNYEIGTSSGGKISNLQTRARIEERVEKKLSNKVKFIYRFHRFERATTKTLVLFSPDDPNNPTNPNGTNYQPGFPPSTEVVDIGSTGPGLQIDLRDDPFNPNSGSYHIFDGELAHPALLASDQVRFYMLMLRNSFYVPLADPFGLALFAGAGYADSLDHQFAIPKARLLTDLSLGGQGSIRGFSPRIFNPLPGSVTAGFYNVRAELRSKILGDLSGAVFVDSGQIYSKVAGAQWYSGLRHDGVGIGLRYKTPVGPAVVDVSQGLGPDKELIKFNFTIGVF